MLIDKIYLGYFKLATGNFYVKFFTNIGFF